MCHCWWTSESPRTHVAKFYCQLRSIRSVLRASKFSVLKLIEIVIVWVYYTIPFGFSLFRQFWAFIFNFRNDIVRLRITDEGSLPEMRIWSIFLIKSDSKWCIHLSRSLYLYYNLLSYWKHVHTYQKQLVTKIYWVRNFLKASDACFHEFHTLLENVPISKNML